MKTGLLYDENDTPLRWEEIPAKYIDAYMACKEWMARTIAPIVTVGAVWTANGYMVFLYRWADNYSPETFEMIISDLDTHALYTFARRVAKNG